MKTAIRIFEAFAQVLLIGAVLLTGCKANNAAPSPLSAEQIPAEMQKAFAKAKPETKQLVEKMLEAFRSKDYPAAYQGGQLISGTAEINKEQLVVTARAMLGINELMKSSSAQGDQNASAFLDYQKHNR